MASPREGVQCGAVRYGAVRHALADLQPLHATALSALSVGQNALGALGLQQARVERVAARLSAAVLPGWLCISILLRRQGCWWRRWGLGCGRRRGGRSASLPDGGSGAAGSAVALPDRRRLCGWRMLHGGGGGMGQLRLHRLGRHEVCVRDHAVASPGQEGIQMRKDSAKTP